MIPRTRTLAAAALAAALAACGPAATGAAQTPAPAPAPAPATMPEHVHSHGPLPASAQGYPWTAADAAFMTHMIGHHAQAIVMSRMAPTHGASPQVQTLAARIINAQQDEIATMQQWLRDRGQPVPDPGAMQTVTMDMGGMQHQMMMPGMLTPEQLARLDGARGPDFDRLFLSFMIQHHSGAVSMVSDLFGSWGAGQDEAVFKFASDVNVDQTTEIARMQRMLADVMFGSPGAPSP